MIRVAHVITGLGTGGAELTLARLLPRLAQSGVDGMVISLKPDGALVPHFEALGIRVVSLGFEASPRALKAGPELLRALRSYAPDLVQTWMYHADLVGGVAARMLRRPVIWNVRTTAPRAFQHRLGLARMCALASNAVPSRIICCSHAARQAHAEFGWNSRGMLVIHNGFDVEQLRPDAGLRLELRRELEISDSAPVIGLVARYNPVKDHATFLEAARRFAAARPDAHFVLCGDEVTWENPALKQPIVAAGLASKFRLLGRRADVHKVNAALDVASCCSLTEGMPNVVGEAMACGVPCVVTDVGDSALLVGDTGRVVPVRDASALAAGWEELIGMGRESLTALGTQARVRITEKFSMHSCTRRYAEVYQSEVERVGRH